MPSFWFVLFLYPALFAAVAVHETGHALFARIAGYTVTSLGLGAAHPVWTFTLPGAVRVFLCRDAPTLGTCWTISAERLPTRRARALLFAGGGAANLAVAVVSFVLWRDFHGGGVWLALFVMNALLAVMNLLPVRLRLPGSGGTKAVASDGLQAASLFWTRRVRAEPPASELGFQSLWQAVGDTRTERFRLCAAAFAAIGGGDIAAAESYADAAHALPLDPVSDAHLWFLQAQFALSRGDTNAATESLAQARASYTAQNAAGSVFLCDLLRVQALPIADALPAWETLARQPFARRADAATPLAASRLLLFTRSGTGDAATLETLLARYERARRNHRTDAEDAAVYAAVATWRDAHGDPVGAQLARDRAHTPTDRLLPSAREKRRSA